MKQSSIKITIGHFIAAALWAFMAFGVTSFTIDYMKDKGKTDFNDDIFSETMLLVLGVFLILISIFVILSVMGMAMGANGMFRTGVTGYTLCFATPIIVAVLFIVVAAQGRSEEVDEVIEHMGTAPFILFGLGTLFLVMANFSLSSVAGKSRRGKSVKFNWFRPIIYFAAGAVCIYMLVGELNDILDNEKELREDLKIDEIGLDMISDRAFMWLVVYVLALLVSGFAIYMSEFPGMVLIGNKNATPPVQAQAPFAQQPTLYGQPQIPYQPQQPQQPYGYEQPQPVQQPCEQPIPPQATESVEQAAPPQAAQPEEAVEQSPSDNE